MGSSRRQILRRVQHPNAVLIVGRDLLNEVDLNLLPPAIPTERFIGTAPDFYLRLGYSPDCNSVQLEWWQAGEARNPKTSLLRDDDKVLNAIKTSAFADVVVAGTTTLDNLNGL